MAGEELLTLTIQPYEKAIILKSVLEREGIEVVVGNVSQRQPLISSGVRLRIHERDLPKALSLLETTAKDRQSKGEILIPVDFSDYSAKACLVGFGIAHAEKRPVVVLHSYMGQYFSGSLPLDVKLRKENSGKEVEAHRQMAEFEERLKQIVSPEILSAVEYRCEVVEGIPEDAVLEYAKQSGPELIVMGTRGKHKKEEDLIGSVTAEVLDSVAYPLLAIPEGFVVNETVEKRNIVFYSNLEQSDLMSLDVLMRKFKGVRVFIAHVKSGHEKFVDERLEALGLYCRHQYADSEFLIRKFTEPCFLDEFEQCLIDDKIELVVIPNKKRNIFTRLFSPSIAHRIMFHTDIPMLVVPTKK